MASDPHGYVIWSFEHDAWWGPGLWGYTHELALAGDYTQADAEAIVHRANIVAMNEQALLRTEAEAFGPPRFRVVREHNPHGGPGWAIYDLVERSLDGGWFADRAAADQTAAVLNRRS